MKSFMTIAVALLVLASILKALSNHFFDNFQGLEEDHSMYQNLASKKNTIVCKLTVESRDNMCKPGLVSEAWIEDRHISDHYLVWFPYYRRIGGYNICVTTDDDNVRFDMEPIGSAHSWTHGSHSLVYYQTSVLPPVPIQLKVTKPVQCVLYLTLSKS